MAKAEIIKKERKMKKTNKKGFTIVELVIVIAVIAILAAVLIPTFTNVVEKANQSAALQACETEYKQMAIAAASNGTTVDESVVFCKGKYYFSLENGGMTACDSSKVSGKTPTNLANGVKVYGKVGVKIADKSIADKLSGTTYYKDNNYANIDKLITFENSSIIYNENGITVFNFTATNVITSGKISFSMWYEANAADHAQAVSECNCTTITTKEEAIGYYTYILNTASGTVSGIFYYGA